MKCGRGGVETLAGRPLILHYGPTLKGVQIGDPEFMLGIKYTFAWQERVDGGLKNQIHEMQDPWTYPGNRSPMFGS